MLNDKKMQESIPCKMHLNFIMKHCFPQSLLMKNAYHKIATIKNLILKNWSGAIPLTLDSLFLHLHLLVASFYYPQNKHFFRVEQIQKLPFMQIQFITLIYKTSHIIKF